MLKELITVAKTKLWLNTVNKYKGHTARRDLEALTKTLSPKNQAWAKELRARLDANPKDSVAILREESAKLFDKHEEVRRRVSTLVTNSTTVTNS